MRTYLEALRLIFGRADMERGERPPYSERVWRLDRMRELLGALDQPHRAYRSVHIAGTKGKGSTTVMVESILRAAGYRTGMYTSPHLHTFRERIQVLGRPATEEEIVALVERLDPILATRPDVTVFEIMTAMAMALYAQASVDWAVFEVGLGGRLDATNALLPDICGITSISLDHMNVLGHTIGEIAAEKAGIIKEGVPVVSSPQRPEAWRVIREIAAERVAPLTLVGRDWCWERLEADLAGQRLAVYSRDRAHAPEFPVLHLPLLGKHQIENCCTAVAIIQELAKRGLPLPDDAVEEGIRTTCWPGRMEVLSTAPLLVVDGAHNGDSMSRLFEAISEHFPHRRTLLVFGAGQTHEPATLLDRMVDVDTLYACQAAHPKATPSSQLTDLARERGLAVGGTGGVAEMLDRALGDANSDDLILATGSLFVVAEARRAWLAGRGIELPSDPPGAY